MAREMPKSEPDLICRAAGGDQQSLAVLMYRYYDRLVGRVRRNLPERLREVFDPEDIVQQTHIQAFQHIKSFHPQREPSLYFWLATIADHLLIDAVRKYRRQATRHAVPASSSDPSGSNRSLDALIGDERTPSHFATRREAARALHVAMAGLNARQREALSLLYLQQLELAEVAARMRATKQTVRSLAYHGRENLKKALGRLSDYLSHH
jgi:RNA polymerase sigma factor (sigma-70 family)